MTNKSLYLFDFDGTISSKDSFIHFFLKSYKKSYILKKLIFNFHLILYTAIVKKEKSKVKELIISLFLKGKTKEEINTLGKKYGSLYIQEIIRPLALDYLYKIKKDSKNDVYIVSASLYFWLYHFAENISVKLISTKLAYSDNKFSGKFKGENCKGMEKVNRIREEIDLKSYKQIISFGDSKGDVEMFSISTKTNYKPFRDNCKL